MQDVSSSQQQQHFFHSVASQKSILNIFVQLLVQLRAPIYHHTSILFVVVIIITSTHHFANVSLILSKSECT